MPSSADHAAHLAYGRSKQLRVHFAEAEEVRVARGSMGRAEPEIE
jgi:hypothetical protein